jgi:hypothetical protein
MHALTADSAGSLLRRPRWRRCSRPCSDNPADTARFLGVIARTVPAADFFAPANLARITGTDLAA